MTDENRPSSSNDVDDESNTVTMMDVLKAEELMEENAEAVLGPGDDKNCTYSRGYLKRQALYSCLTCLPADGTKYAGVCLACSYHCHGDHDLVELYTKRNFKCDCGNSLFKDKKCTLDSVKSDTNENNCYNKNFKGLYCSCNRPYPDPEETVDDEMLQCIVCEDWFHTRHLGSSVPDDYSELICGSCMDKLPFLQYYLGYSVTKVVNEDEGNDSTLNVSEVGDSSSASSPQKRVQNQSEGTTSAGQDVTVNNLENETPEANKNGLCITASQISMKMEDSAIEKDNHDKSKSPTKGETKEIGSEKCLLNSLKLVSRGCGGATFWPEGFRKMLCTCVKCLELYASKGVSFLTDEEDTVHAYEEKGKTRRMQAGVNEHDRVMNALSSLNRVQQIEAITNYNEMKNHLSEYLAKFVENKKVVRAEDIQEFFSGLQARKRQKLDISYSCR